MAGEGVPQGEMEELVRSIVTGADLTLMTGKVVREKVLETLGDRAGKDDKAIKRSVRDALKAVLADSVTPAQAIPNTAISENPAPSPKPERATNPTAVENQVGSRVDMPSKPSLSPEVLADVGKFSSSPEDKTRSSGRRRLRKLSRRSPTREGHEDDLVPADEDGEVPGTDMNKAPIVEAVSKAQGKGHDEMLPVTTVARASESENDDDFADELAQRVASKKRRERLSVEGDGDEADDEFEGEKELPRPKKEPSPSSNPPLAKRMRAHHFTNEKHLEKLKTLCNQLGCKGVSLRMRGKTVADKCAGLVDFLAKKGVTNLTLTKKDIRNHRMRIEREAELSALDTSNIIEDGRRSRRGRRPAPVPEPKAELPSDLSGEPSESSAEEEADEYQASSQESE